MSGCIKKHKENYSPKQVIFAAISGALTVTSLFWLLNH